MKRVLLTVATVVAVLSLMGCSSKLPSPTGNPDEVTGVNYIEQSGDVADTVFSIGDEEVSLYIPSDYLYSNVQSIADDAKAKGGYDVTVYGDGALSYKMSRGDYDKMMADNKAAFEKNITDLQQRYNRIYADIKYNNDFSHMDFYIDAQAYAESGDTMLIENLYVGSRMYQMYMGKNPEVIKMTFNTYDAATGEQLEASTYPDDLNN